MPSAVVDLRALLHNLEVLRSHLAPACQVLAAVKAQAYGHGAVPVARALERAGVTWFGVATPGEAMELRNAGINGRVLLFGPASRDIPSLVEAAVELTVVDPVSLEAIRRSGVKGALLHLKVDTGMGRLGETPGEALALARQIAEEPRLELAAVWTHFACADEPDASFTERQIERFEEFQERLSHESLLPPLMHACNSAGLLGHPRAHYSLVRPGIALYGYPPRDSKGLELKPTMTITAPVTFVKRVRAGTPLSYGATWRAPRDTTVATVRYGYGDGYPRLLSNRGWASFQGHSVPVVGRVCMDQLLVDVGDLDVAVGNSVSLLAPEGPTADDLAGLIGTISYEILTSVSPRVERVYRH